MNKGINFIENKELGLIFGIVLISIILFSACNTGTDIPNVHTPTENGYGRIAINLTGDGIDLQQVRTVFPLLTFDKYVYTFTKAGEDTGEEKSPDNEGYFILEVGVYSVEVKAYVGDDEPYTLVASGVSSEFTVGFGNNEPVAVILSEVNYDAQGEFTYTITFPAGSIPLSITLLKWPDESGGLDIITLTPNNLNVGNGVTQTLQLETGSYLFTVLIGKDTLNAGISEAIHISSLSTVYTKAFEDIDFHASP